MVSNLEAKGGGGSEGIGRLLDMDAGEIGALCHNHRMGETVCLHESLTSRLHVFDVLDRRALELALERWSYGYSAGSFKQT